MRLVFVSSGWFCGELNPVKSLYKQTYTSAQRRQRTENNQAEDRPLLFSFYIPLVNMSTWSHICSHHHNHLLPIHMHTHTDVEAHKSTAGCILDLPSPTSQPPLFKQAALTDFHMKRCLHRPTQSPSQSLKSTLHPHPSSQPRPLPRA